jgi:hypothetical protein
MHPRGRIVAESPDAELIWDGALIWDATAPCFFRIPDRLRLIIDAVSFGKASPIITAYLASQIERKHMETES